MLEIERTKNNFNYDVFYIKTDEGVFEISFQNNFDLYWRYIPKESVLLESNEKTFFITKENYFLYELFLNLYESIKNSTPLIGYSNSIENLEMKFFNELFFENKIQWFSDDFGNLDNASSLTIEYDDEIFKVIFRKSKEDYECGMYFPTFNIRFRNSGSRYTPYNITFMKMYNDLKDYVPEFHQVHIEEILYAKKIKKGK